MARLRGSNNMQYFRRFPSSARVIDLSQLISESMAVYPGDPRPRTRLLTTIEGAGASTTELILGTHTGTHVDAPCHVLPEGRSVDEFPLETFYGSAWVYDLTHKPRGSQISSSDLNGDSIPLRKGEIALLYTGSSGSNAGFTNTGGYTYLHKSAADWFVEKKVKAVGIDSISVDPFGSDTYEVHRTLFRNDVVVIENLSSNLRFLVGKNVLFFCVPLKLKNVEASPVRAFAFWS